MKSRNGFQRAERNKMEELKPCYHCKVMIPMQTNGKQKYIFIGNYTGKFPTYMIYFHVECFRSVSGDQYIVGDGPTACQHEWVKNPASTTESCTKCKEARFLPQAPAALMQCQHNWWKFPGSLSETCMNCGNMRLAPDAVKNSYGENWK